MSFQVSTINSQPSVELHIEELVLHGFASSDRHRIAGAVERELTRLFSEGPTPLGLTTSSSIAGLDAGSFQLPPPSKPEATGAQVARAVFRGLQQ